MGHFFVKTPAEGLGRKTPEAFCRAEKLPLIIVLDNVRSAANVGSIFRSADAFLAEKILLCGITPQPPHREIEKTALGATRSVQWAYQADIIQTLSQLRQENYRLLAVEQTCPSTLLQNFKVAGRQAYALVFGNELHGVQDKVLALCSEVLEIPQFGTKHSLNVSVSAGIVMWHWAQSFSVNRA